MKTQQSKILGMQQRWSQRGKYIAIQANLKKQEKPQIHNLTLHVKELDKEQQIKPDTSRREIIKIRAEINDIDTNNQNKKPVEQINEPRNWFLEKN